MSKKNSLHEKWEKDPVRFKRITNDDLVCKDCAFRLDDSEIYGNTSRCEVFPDIKPGKVINGGKCDEYLRD